MLKFYFSSPANNNSWHKKKLLYCIYVYKRKSSILYLCRAQQLMFSFFSNCARWRGLLRWAPFLPPGCSQECSFQLLEMLLPKVCLLFFFAFTHALGSNYSLVNRDKKMEEIVARKRPSLLLTLEVSDLAMATKNWDLDGNARDIRLPINKGGKLRWFSRKLGICKVR